MRARNPTLPALLLALASLACKPPPPPPEPEKPDAGPPVDSLVVLPADAGPEQIAEAEKLALRLVHSPDAPKIRLDLRVDLAAADFFGFEPGGPIASVVKRLGEPAEKRAMPPNAGAKVELWRWPALGAEVTVVGGNVAARIGLAAQERTDNDLRIFPGAVQVGMKPFTNLAPNLTLQESVKALGVAGARVHADAAIHEAGWAHDKKALFLVFDSETLLLESLQLEPFDGQLWEQFKPADLARDVWDHPPKVPEPGKLPTAVDFAQLGEVVTPADLPKLKVIGAGLPDAKAFFENLELRFLKPGESLRRVKGARVAVLRSEAIELVVRETGATWEARRLSGTGPTLREKAVLERVRSLFLAAPPGAPIDPAPKK